MDKSITFIWSNQPPEVQQALKESLGYVNFSNGSPSAQFQANLNEIWRQTERYFTIGDLRELLLDSLITLDQSEAAFQDIRQARQVIDLALKDTFPALLEFHSDLFFHLDRQIFVQPFLVARIFEAVLSQEPPWGETERIVEGAISQLNSFLGYRPVAVLENEQLMQPYPQERFPPLPLYLRDAGAAVGPYEALIRETLEALERTPEPLRRIASLDPGNLDELSLDLRAHDHTHPANKRTNYMFGEWDPHVIDISGNYRRFILRKIILDALVNWMNDNEKLPLEERLHDASCVLCGTMLMASAISGAGPDTHQSGITLSSLLPQVARLRDRYYEGLLASMSGSRGQRLLKEAQLTQQPFGHVRQSLNIYLAQYGSMQVQLRQLALLYARMGYPQAAREKANVIPCLSTRFETEIQLRLTTALLQLTHGELQRVTKLIEEVEDLLQRGIRCGGLVDPWNILGFQGHFPLFISREDAVLDQRVESLITIMEQLFEVYSRALGEAAAQGNRELSKELSDRFQGRADWWDRFATTTVEDLPHISGETFWDSATSVASTLGLWRAAGSEAGNISFWREHVERLTSGQSYALVVEALLQKGDTIAAMGLLMQWLSQAEDVGLEASGESLYNLMIRWMRIISHGEQFDPLELWNTYRRLFAFLEANAGEFWEVPQLSEATGQAALRPQEEDLWDEEDDLELEDDEDNLFSAAYDNVIYRDSTDDGIEGELADGDFSPMNTEFDIITRALEPRVKFLNVIAQLWHTAGVTLSTRFGNQATGKKMVDLSPEQQNQIMVWRDQNHKMQRQIGDLIRDVWDHPISEPSGDQDSNLEYDVQVQRKFYLVHTLISTHINFATAEKTLLCCLPKISTSAKLSKQKTQMVQVMQSLIRRDVQQTKALLPQWIRKIRSKPLLYIPMENGGEPRQILEARHLQSVIRFLLSELPKLGLLRETWHLLQTAYEMERTTRPGGIAVTEFDRLFRTALQSSLECISHSWREWKTQGYSEETLLEVIHELVQTYREQWIRHSTTMRLSAVEPLFQEGLWEETKEFIETYGGDLFHAKMLTLGSLRAILHHGVGPFLDHWKETLPPYQSVLLLDDLARDHIKSEDVIAKLDLIYSIVVDKFERFLEYNTTTTQSDYGEKFACLLDFLRVEARYDRDAWNLTPERIVHEVLVKEGLASMVTRWEDEFQKLSREKAITHLDALVELEEKYGMHLPALADHLNERFVKPLAVNRMIALVPQAMRDARQIDTGMSSSAFQSLQREVDTYLENVSGAGIDIPAWLRNLEHEVEIGETFWLHATDERETDLKLPPVKLSYKEVRSQLDHWFSPLTPASSRKKPKKTNPDESTD